ncbi:hypothetical protein KGQ19_16330 [Catenulispora sp. NL8]|uniref:BMP family ABC transporter substrate-binding protein n=1 Tax=Catenulispora pinistramenti TaxID=2705254 RepID=A0ABS5KQW8_9ACTN|nr:hypothetical protein [Catenulispora pinistramenti]MBS2548435.1 hypothetical protein [Catenulispora pinistramenti]
MAIAVVGGAVAVMAARSGSRHAPVPPKPVSTVAANKRVCLLTDGSPAAQTAWAGMQDFAKGGGINIQRTTIPPKAPDADSYLSGILQQNCLVIVAVGNGPAQAADDAAAYHPETRFVVIGSAQRRANTAVLTNQSELSSLNVSAAIRKLVN